MKTTNRQLLVTETNFIFPKEISKALKLRAGDTLEIYGRYLSDKNQFDLYLVFGPDLRNPSILRSREEDLFCESVLACQSVFSIYGAGMYHTFEVDENPLYENGCTVYPLRFVKS